MPIFDVNNDAVIKLTADLEKIHRSAFPSAVRNTLNEAAFGMKRQSIPNSFKKNFKPKSGTMPYVKSLIRIERANGFDVNKMAALVGFLDPSSSSDKRFVEGLVKQEGGGVIDDGLRYLKGARGNRVRGKVRTENFYDKTKVISGRSKRNGTRKSKFVARAYQAMKTGKPMFMNSMKGNFLVKVNSVSSNVSSKKMKFNFTFIAMDRKTKKTNLKKTNFVREAGIIQSAKMNDIYQRQAEYQFKKYLK